MRYHWRRFPFMQRYNLLFNNFARRFLDEFYGHERRFPLAIRGSAHNFPRYSARCRIAALPAAERILLTIAGGELDTLDSARCWAIIFIIDFIQRGERLTGIIDAF